MQDSPTDRKQQAQIYLRRALNYYEQNNRSAAIKALGMALEFDRSLTDNPRIQQFAQHLIGERGSAAIETLTNRDSRDSAAALRAKLTRKTPSIRSNPLWVGGILLIAIASVGLIVVYSLGHIGLTTPQVEHYTLANDPNQEYLVTVPTGSVPEDGWQVLVAIHGAGQSGQDMVDMLGETARTRGIVLIAPTFPAIREGQADEAYYEAARTTLQQITNEVIQTGMTNPNFYAHSFGQVYLGYAEGASLATYAALKGLDYADSGFVMEGPMGVVLVNAAGSLYDATRYPIPYLLLYGERAPHADVSRDYNERLTRQGTEVYLIQADGGGETMTSQQLTITADFVHQVYYPPTEPLTNVFLNGGRNRLFHDL